MIASISKTQEPTTYRELVQGNANFRWLWFGQIVSLFGDWFNLIASVALIAALTESGLAVGGLFVVRMLAPFLTSPLAGVVADSCNRRNILIAADIVRGVVVLGMLIVRSEDLVWLLYVLTALQLGTTSFFFTARKAMLPDIVEGRTLGTANALTAATWSVMLAVAAGLGGFATGLLGVHAALTIDAATFFLSAALVAQIRWKPQLTEDRPTAVKSAFAMFREVIRYLFRTPDILIIALHKTALTLLLGTSFRVVQTAIAERIFPVGQQGTISMGLLFAVAGIGTGLGPLAMRYFTRDDEQRLRLAIVGGYVVGGLGLTVSAQLVNLETMVVGAFLAGVGNGILWVFSSQLLLQLVPKSVRGRVFATEFAFFTLASAAGSAVVGSAIDLPLGMHGLLTTMATLTLVPCLAWSFWLAYRAFWQYDDASVKGESHIAVSSAGPVSDKL